MLLPLARWRSGAAGILVAVFAASSREKSASQWYFLYLTHWSWFALLLFVTLAPRMSRGVYGGLRAALLSTHAIVSVGYLGLIVPWDASSLPRFGMSVHTVQTTFLVADALLDTAQVPTWSFGPLLLILGAWLTMALVMGIVQDMYGSLGGLGVGVVAAAMTALAVGLHALHLCLARGAAALPTARVSESPEPRVMAVAALFVASLIGVVANAERLNLIAVGAAVAAAADLLLVYGGLRRKPTGAAAAPALLALFRSSAPLLVLLASACVLVCAVSDVSAKRSSAAAALALAALDARCLVHALALVPSLLQLLAPTALPLCAVTPLAAASVTSAPGALAASALPLLVRAGGMARRCWTHAKAPRDLEAELGPAST